MSSASIVPAAKSFFTLGMSGGGSASSAAKSFFTLGGTGASVAAAANSLTPKIPDIPTPTPSTPAQAPAFGDSAQQDAQKKTLAALQRRQGRAASILTAGGLDNSSSKLGG